MTHRCRTTWLPVASSQHEHSCSVEHKDRHMTATRQRLCASGSAGMLMTVDNDVTEEHVVMSERLQRELLEDSACVD